MYLGKKRYFKSEKLSLFSYKKKAALFSIHRIYNGINSTLLARARARAYVTRISHRQHVTNTWCEHVQSAPSRINNTFRAPRETLTTHRRIPRGVTRMRETEHVYLYVSNAPLPPPPFPPIILISLQKIKLVNISH